MAGALTIRQVWDAAAEVAAAAYGVDPALLRAPSRGRGPRPPREVWEARKVVVHITIMVGGCDYAALGREVGLHRDTVASHCAEVREAAIEEQPMGVLASALEYGLRARLSVSPPFAGPRKPTTPLERLDALERFTLRWFSVERARLSDDGRPSSDTSDKSRICEDKSTNGRAAA